MSRIPPNLLYLTIYNPTLQPPGPVQDGDEDAEEQAHILFYTSKERAVSRDRMLRQVGLAKALVNFSDMFNGAASCDNVHSQSKRLIMVSPEPDFWIHAGIEVAKVRRSPVNRGKGKGRSRPPEKGREKEADKEVAPLSDHQEGSVHDLALRADILRAYEKFKEGLELQLERFFTVWAWSWNLEDGTDFRDHLVKHPTSLARHLLSLIPPTPTASEDLSHNGTVKSRRPSDSHGKDPPAGQSGSSFLGISAANMDVRKWGWPGVLTFGKGAGKRPGTDKPNPLTPATGGDDTQATETRSTEAIGLDKSALEDAFADNMSIAASIASNKEAEVVHSIPSSNDDKVDSSTEPQSIVSIEQSEDAVEPPQDFHSPTPDPDSTSIISSPPPATAPPAPPADTPPSAESFCSVKVYLADPVNPLLTIRQKVYYMLHDRSMVALIGLNEDDDPSPELAQSTLRLLDDIDAELAAQLSHTVTPDQIPNLAKILQPTDTHIVSTGTYTMSSSNFSSKAGYLNDAQELQAIDSEISEVFSRGQNPQHWHIARRGLGANAVASATVVLTLLSLLLLTLFVTLISSALLTLTGIALYALASLFSLLRAQGTHGVTLWGEQMSEFLVGTLPVRGQSEGEKAQPYSHSHAARSGMYKGAGEGIGLESSRMGSGRLGSTLGPFDEGFGTPRANAPYRWLNFHSEEGDIDDPDRGLDLDGYLSDAHSSEMGHKARVKREGGGGEDEQENGIRVKRQRLEDADAADSEDDALYVDSAVAQAEGDVELLPAEGDAGDVLG
ncbi:hypothetical protein DXG03_009614 [Asterophora parasitica]|uniref:CCZ1/INTU/HSP4 first Longin domain-containing protein n=1 Tax=Asterophora parasitica TaxID=117018 RepID=A0A9P7G621_9AGAR|nr:hypothetical protein DXG03_009614 [Asterophora parasitica]